MSVNLPGRPFAAVWLPPMLFRSAERRGSFQLTLLSTAAGAILGWVMTVGDDGG